MKPPKTSPPRKRAPRPDVRARLAALKEADAARAPKAPAARVTARHSLTSVAVPAALLDRLRDLVHARRKAGERVAPWRIIEAALDALEAAESARDA